MWNVKLKETTGEGRIMFSVNQREVVSVITVNTPLGVVNFYIVNALIPFLLSLANMD